MRHPENARLNHLKNRSPNCVRKIRVLVGRGPEILLSPFKYYLRGGRENQLWAASHHLLCAPESRVQQHQLPGIRHGAGQGDVDVISNQRHQCGEQDTGRPHPSPARRARGWTRRRDPCYPKTSGKFL